MDDREQALNEVLVDFAANLCRDFSVQSILDHLVASTVDLLHVSGAGVMAVDAGDDLHFVAATDEVVRTIEVLQRETGEGPCLQAHRSGRPCAVDDLALGEQFPEFSRRALQAGMAAVFSFPLRAAGLNLGALDLYRETPGPLDADDVRVAAVLADVAAAYLVNARARADSSVLLADLNHRSLHDALTGLPNRTLLAELLAEALNRAVRSRRRIAVLFIDLDEFKAVNDRFGHHVGDQLLIAVSARLTAALRPGDTLARLSGDEFVAVCDDLPDGSRAADVAHRLLTAMATPFHLGGHDLELGTSIGIALSDRRHPTDAQHLLATADAAMYEAKRAGGQRHHLRYATRSDHSPTAPQLQAVGDSITDRTSRPDRSPLGSPVDHDRFSTVYQPVVGLRDQEVVAVETLLRWKSSSPGATPPSTIIDEAERSGAILGLGDWVLRQACRDARRWRGRNGRAPLTSVNVSAQQITGPAFVRALEGALTETGLEPASLCLELTESAALPDDRRTVDVLRSVKELGVKLWLDDFGSGYSSLNYLRVFPLDAVKIDPSFAPRLPSERASRAIIASTTALCHELGLDVIVEGIENATELSAATELGVDAVQGFHLGRPLSADETSALLDGEHREEAQPPAGAPKPREPDATPPRHPRSRTRSNSVTTVEHLLRSGTLRAAFQPIVDLDTSRVVAHEALTRGPAGDLAGPLALFASARREGLLAELDDECRSTAVRAVLEQQRSRTTLFLNAEPEAFAALPAAAAWDVLSELVASTAIDLDVILEITERDIPTRPATLLRNVERIRELGWRIALDDVGASAASLAFMPLLRPDVVKLDTALVQRPPSPETAQIVHAVNDYAERTGALVLAEGIETARHLSTARAFGARLGQGWLFGRPEERLSSERPAPFPLPRNPRAPDTAGRSIAAAPRPLPRPSTPFASLSSAVRLRRASKALLMQLSTQLEEQAGRSGQTCILTSAFQHARHFTPATAKRYARVAEQAGFVYAVGEAFAGVDVPGVQVASVAADDPLCREWDVAILGPHFHAALLAREVGGDRPDRERVFEYAVTYRYDTVVAATRTLLLHVADAPGTASVTASAAS